MKASCIISMILLVSLAWLSGAPLAQSRLVGPAPRPPERFSCTSELFDNAEQAYRRKVFEGAYAFRAGKLYRQIQNVCPNASLIPEVKRRISVLDEEAAEHRFIIANYYFNLYKDRGSGLRGAQSRFREIVDLYPNYSKIDTALFFLAETHFFQQDQDAAIGYYTRLFAEHPNSDHADEARLRIREISERK